MFTITDTLYIVLPSTDAYAVINTYTAPLLTLPSVMTMATPISLTPKSEPPPPPVVVMLAFTDLHLRVAPSILALEDLSRHPRPKPTNIRHHPYTRPVEVPPVPRPRRSTPPPQPIITRCSTPPHPASSRPPTPTIPAAPQSAGSRETTPSSLSSLSRSPSPNPPPAQQPKHVSFASKIRIERPKGAGRTNLLKLVKWEPAYLDGVKVRTA